jgi:hypothetical protein
VLPELIEIEAGCVVIIAAPTIMVNLPVAERPVKFANSHALIVIGKEPVCVGTPVSVVDLPEAFVNVKPLGRGPLETFQDSGVRPVEPTT